MFQVLPKFNKILLPIAIVIILALVGVLVWRNLSAKDNTDKNAELSDRAETFSGMTSRDYLIFKKISADPFKVKEGEEQKFFLTIEDSAGVESIKVRIQHDLGEDVKGMKLAEGNDKKGKWFVAWTTHDLSSQEYQAVFVVRNKEGRTEETTFFWQHEESENINKSGWLKKLKYLIFSPQEEALAGSCSFTSGANCTMGSNCSISNIDGVDGGNLTVNATLQLNAGSNLVFNPGKQISVGGTIWVNQSGSEISKGYICVTDSDNDGCWVGSKTKSSSATCPSGKRRLKDATYYPDCDDNNASYCQTCCYPHDHKGCYNNDVYWYDSCGSREGKVLPDCGSDSWGSSYRCSGGTRQRTWIDRGCSSASCFANTSWKNYQNCGSDGWTNNYRCSGSNRQRQIRRRGCSGTSCYDYYEWVTIENCGSDYCNSWGSNYCSGGDVYHQRTCYNRGCSGTSCYSNSYTDTQKVQECYSDSWTNNYRCSGTARQRRIRRRGCSGSSCYSYYQWITIDGCSIDCSCGDGSCNCGENHSSCPGDCPVINLPTCSFTATAGVWIKHAAWSWSNSNRRCKMNTTCEQTRWWPITAPQQLKTTSSGSEGTGNWGGIYPFGIVIPAWGNLCVISPEYSYTWTGSLPTCSFNGTKGDVWAKPERCSWSYKCELGTTCNKKCSSGKVKTGGPDGLLCATGDGVVYEYCDVCVVRQ